MNELKWIPCSERLPEDEFELVLISNGNDMEQWITIDYLREESQGDAIAWMPLPKPYIPKGFWDE